MNEKLKAKLELLGYNVTDTDSDGTAHYSRETTVGAPADTGGNRVWVFVEVSANQQCSISVDAFNKFGHITIEYKALEIEFFTRNLKTLERQVVYAWREVAD